MMGPMTAAPSTIDPEAAARDAKIARRLRRIVTFFHRLSLPFVRYDIEGGAHIKNVPNMIVVGNHRSLLDFVAGSYTALLFDVHPRILIARRFVDSRWFGPLARWMGAIPVSPGRDGAAALDEGIEALRSGLDTVVMPEGRLHKDPHDRLSLAEGRTGISRLAVGSGVPIVAAGVLGADRAWRPGRPPRLIPFSRRTVAIRVADDPIYLHGDDHRANTELVMAAIHAQMVRAADDHPELL